MKKLLLALALVLVADTAFAGNGSSTNPFHTTRRQGEYGTTLFRTVSTSSVCVVGQTGDTCTGGTIPPNSNGIRSVLIQAVSTNTDAVTCVLSSSAVPTAVAAQGHTLSPGQALILDQALRTARISCIAASGTQTVAYTIEGFTDDRM